MARAEFTAVPGLDEMVARMVAPEVERIADRLKDRVKLLAPPTKIWITTSKNVCEHCIPLHGVELPDNLRFEMPSFEWDMTHRGVGATTFLLYPRDHTSRAYVAVSHCQCFKDADPQGIAKTVERTRVTVTGPLVQAAVYSEANKVVEAEFGTIYDGGAFVSDGTHFMAKAAAQVAAEGRARR